MPVKRTFAKRRQRLNDCKRLQLIEGPSATPIEDEGYFHTGHFDLMTRQEQVKVLAEMKADWKVHRAELMAWWSARDDAPRFSTKLWLFTIPGAPGTLPWAAEQFDEGEKGG